MYNSCLSWMQRCMQLLRDLALEFPGKFMDFVNPELQRNVLEHMFMSPYLSWMKFHGFLIQGIARELLVIPWIFEPQATGISGNFHEPKTQGFLVNCMDFWSKSTGISGNSMEFVGHNWGISSNFLAISWAQNTGISGNCMEFLIQDYRSFW